MQKHRIEGVVSLPDLASYFPINRLVFACLVGSEDQAVTFLQRTSHHIGESAEVLVFFGLEPGSRVQGLSTRGTVPMAVSFVNSAPIDHMEIGGDDDPTEFFEGSKYLADTMIRDSR